MILATAKSKNSIQIRLTDERLSHIVYSHKELTVIDFKKISGTIENPIAVFEGNTGELLATAKFDKNNWIVVVYKEMESDGFVITAYLTTNFKWLFKRRVIWTNKL